MAITLRDATAADAPFIAQCVLAAMSLNFSNSYYSYSFNSSNS